jgi:hypothetical protein
MSSGSAGAMFCERKDLRVCIGHHRGKSHRCEHLGIIDVVSQERRFFKRYPRLLKKPFERAHLVAAVLQALEPKFRAARADDGVLFR